MTADTVVFDVETTGLSPRGGDRVIEIGAVALTAGEITGEFHSLVRVDRAINPFAAKVHGITPQMLHGHPGPDDVLPRFHAFIADRLLVGHNVGFDINFIRHEFGLLGLPFKNRHACTLQTARRKLPRLENHRLETVYRHLVGEIPASARMHRALSDARLTAEVWTRLGAYSAPPATADSSA
jgi:DNA polymerase III subunit epsilon